jgi:hypothetical protein
MIGIRESTECIQI